VTTTEAPPARPAADVARPGRRRRWVTPLAIIALILLSATLIASLRPAPVISYLDPESTQATGTHALADLLAERGTDVERVTTAGAAVSAAGRRPAVMVITSPDLLGVQQLRMLAAAPADLVIVEPDQVTLTDLAPGITVAGGDRIGPVQPDCRLAAARLAGDADLGGIGLRLADGVPGVACYRSGQVASLVQYGRTRTITALGTGAPLENQNLARLGNAALALNLLAGHTHVVWLVPQLALTQVSSPPGPKSLWQLIPEGTYLVAAELGVALLLAAAWRARRLGRLVPERLPVVVRAAETTEGHARLYQARRARGQAGAALRTAALARLTTALGLPATAIPAEVVSALAARSRLSAGQLEQLLFGPAPETDGGLVQLADDLDALEREVRTQ
jgi:Domain of unknown function (DUF4350)